MHKDLTVFAFDSHAVRVVEGRDGEPLFIAADVLATLTLDRKALERLDDDEKGVNSIHTLGGDQEMTVITESGLYSLILTSRKPEAKRFKKWVTAEVLPSIRKTGAYGRSASITQQLAASRHRLKLLDALERERHAEKRLAIHQQLDHASKLLGLPTPDMDKLGWAETQPQASPLLAEFWELYDFLGGDERLNHARDSRYIAVNLHHIEREAHAAKLRPPYLSELRRTLRQSDSPRFLDVRTVNSALHARHNAEARRGEIKPATLKCWVFERGEGLASA